MRVLAIEDSVLVQVDGDIDVLSVSRLKEVLDEAIANAGTSVEVDMTMVSYFDTDGVLCLVEAYRDASARSVDLKVSGASPPVKTALNVLGLEFLVGADPPTEDRKSTERRPYRFEVVRDWDPDGV